MSHERFCNDPKCTICPPITPMSLEDWANRWGVPPEAIEQLCRTAIYTPAIDRNDKSEARVQSEVRLEAAHEGIYLFRNNVGALKNELGQHVRYGLGNDSSKLNGVLKSADLIGIRKRLITQADVGRFIGQFYSRECKRENWRFSGTKEEQAQMRWATLINSQGGDAKVVTGVGSFD